METFHWKVRPDMNVVSEPKVVTVKLGDGYEQRRAAGLNNQLSTYSVTIRVRKCEHPSLKAFLERHGGVRAFQWTPDRKSTRLNSSHIQKSRMPSSA